MKMIIRAFLAVVLLFCGAHSFAADVTLTWPVPTFWSDDNSSTPHPMKAGELLQVNIYCGPPDGGLEDIPALSLYPDLATGLLPTKVTFDFGSAPLHCVTKFVAKRADMPSATESLSMTEYAIQQYPMPRSDGATTVFIAPLPVPQGCSVTATSTVITKCKFVPKAK